MSSMMTKRQEEEKKKTLSISWRRSRRFGFISPGNTVARYPADGIGCILGMELV